MFIMLIKLFTLLLSIVAVSSLMPQTKLEEAKAYAVFPVTTKQLGLLHNLQDILQGVDFVQYGHVDGREARVVVSKETQMIFESILRIFKIPFEIYMDDVKAVAEREIMRNEIARMVSKTKSGSKIDFGSYHRYNQINSYIDDLETRFPDLVTVRDVGTTPEDRIIKLVIISTTQGTDSSKPVFIADAGIHAREWIAPAQALYMLTKLVEEVSGSDLIEKMDWVIFPLLNPDGYEYTHTTERMWRKTRSPLTSILCPGVDGNRNFDFQWMVSGSSSNPCTNNYAGSAPFSEPEVRYFRDVVEEFKERAKVYMAIHSYGSYFLYPYGYNGQSTPDDEELHEVGLKVVQAIDEAADPDSKKYFTGNFAEGLRYMASGTSADWTYAVENIKLSYTLELPGGGDQGFDLPPNKIQEVVEETWEGIVVLAQHIIDQNEILN